MKIFGERLRDLRKEKGLSIAQLSAQINIGVASLSCWENDKAIVNGEQIVIIARFFKVSSDYLLGLED